MMQTMRARLWPVVAMALFAAGLSGIAPTAPATAIHEPCHAGYSAEDLYIEMSDGVRLRYTFDLPVDPAGECLPGPFPVVLQTSVYGQGYGSIPYWQDLKSRGYAIINVSVRGTACSGGEWDSLSERERQDTHEIIQWITERWWSNDRIALVGASHPAIQALSGAPNAPEALDAVVAMIPSADLYRDTLFPGGIPNVAIGYTAVQAGFSTVSAAAAVPPNDVRGPDIRCAEQFADRPSIAPFVPGQLSEWDDGIVRDRSPVRHAHDIDAPVFLAVGWQDEVVGSRAVDILRELQVPYHAILTNGGHGIPNTKGMKEKVFAFLDHYLRDAPDYAQAPVELWWDTTPSAGARWTTSHGRWPLEQAKPTPLHLGEGGRLHASATPLSGTDSYAYVPATGQSTFDGGWAVPPKPGAAVAYTFDVAEDLVVVGSASLDLWLSSTAPDTDLQVVLVEERDGQELYVGQGFLRASHRQLDEQRSSPTRPYHTHLPPGAPLVGVEPVRVEIMPFAHVFREGTKLRVYVESPRFIDTWSLYSDREAALNTIHHGGVMPSKLVLPVVPGIKADPRPTQCTSRQPCRPAPPSA